MCICCCCYCRSAGREEREEGWTEQREDLCFEGFLYFFLQEMMFFRVFAELLRMTGMRRSRLCFSRSLMGKQRLLLFLPLDAELPRHNQQQVQQRQQLGEQPPPHPLLSRSAPSRVDDEKTLVGRRASRTAAAAAAAASFKPTSIKWGKKNNGKKKKNMLCAGNTATQHNIFTGVSEPFLFFFVSP